MLFAPACVVRVPFSSHVLSASIASSVYLSSDTDEVVSLATYLVGEGALTPVHIAVLRVILAAVILLITAIVARFVTKGIVRLLCRMGDDVPTAIFINIGRVAVWCTGIAVVLSTCFNIDPSGIVTALGVGGIAISLGMQDTVANLIGGLQLSTMGTLKKGDYVKIGTVEGVVEDIAWRETTILGFGGERSVVPNKAINSNSLTVFPPARKVKVPIQIPYAAGECCSERGMSVEQFGQRIAQAVTVRLTDPAPEGLGLRLQDEAVVQFSGMADGAINASAVVWIVEGEEFDRPAVQSAMVSAASDACLFDECE